MRIRRVLRHSSLRLLRSWLGLCLCSGRVAGGWTRRWTRRRADQLRSGVWLWHHCVSAGLFSNSFACDCFFSLTVRKKPPPQILAFAIGDVSGAHINPAVTLSLAITGNLAVPTALIYVVAQTLGGLAGGGLLYAAVGPQLYKSGIGLSVGAGGGLLFEFMGTLLLIFVVFNVAVWSGNPVSTDFGGTVVSSLAPLPIGLAVMVAHLTLGPFTGCGINPAVSTTRFQPAPLAESCSSACSACSRACV